MKKYSLLNFGIFCLGFALCTTNQAIYSMEIEISSKTINTSSRHNSHDQKTFKKLFKAIKANDFSTTKDLLKVCNNFKAKNVYDKDNTLLMTAIENLLNNYGDKNAILIFKLIIYDEDQITPRIDLDFDAINKDKKSVFDFIPQKKCILGDWLRYLYYEQMVMRKKVEKN